MVLGGQRRNAGTLFGFLSSGQSGVGCKRGGSLCLKLQQGQRSGSVTLHGGGAWMPGNWVLPSLNHQTANTGCRRPRGADAFST